MTAAHPPHSPKRSSKGLWRKRIWVAFTAVMLCGSHAGFAQSPATSEQTASYVQLYFYHSPLGIDWSTPRNLARSVVKNKNSGEKRAIGHVSVELSCGHTGAQVWTGMSDDSVNYRGLIMKEGYGLGILFEGVPGRLEQADVLQEEFDELARAGRIHSMKVLVSNATCDRLQNYLQEFRERKAYAWYGLPNRPRHEEGAGCSAFGVSFLEIGGLMREEWNTAWMRRLEVPEMWIGGAETNREVPFKRLYFLRKKLNHWGQQDGPVRDVIFWDPDQMHEWVKAAYDGLQKEPQADFETIEENGVRTVIWDARNHPTSQEPFWLSKSKE